MSDFIYSPVSDISASHSLWRGGTPVEEETRPRQPHKVCPPYPCYPEEMDLYNQLRLEITQLQRVSISPPLIPGDRPAVSQKRRKPQSAPPNPPPHIPINSLNPFGIDENGLTVQTRPPPLQMEGQNHLLSSEGYLTPPLTSKSFPSSQPVQGPFGGFTSPTVIPSDIVYDP